MNIIDNITKASKKDIIAKVYFNILVFLHNLEYIGLHIIDIKGTIAIKYPIFASPKLSECNYKAKNG